MHAACPHCHHAQDGEAHALGLGVGSHQLYPARQIQYWMDDLSAMLKLSSFASHSSLLPAVQSACVCVQSMLHGSG